MLPIPPAQIQPPPPQPSVGREIAFPGFNGLPLRASICPGKESPWFAVLVAGTGPMDRDWSSPLFPPGHAGRDFALWLQDQGLGSLRYDKRYITHPRKDLDISLDAQTGDIRAALQAARNFPEAKNKKILLIGHSEGALLSLLVASEADALLLIAPPPASMAKALATQLQAQIPSNLRPPNLAYLEAALQAIRAGDHLPAPSSQVHPRMAQLTQALAAPETLSYVRATLDLDPWTIAARLTLPMALAWGDRDIQSGQPTPLPSDLKATLLTIPQANFLLKQETRPRNELDGARAMETYGENTPRADLSAIASWLKRLTP